MHFKHCYMLLFKKTIKRIIDRRIAEIKRLEHLHNGSKCAINNLNGLKKDLGLD